MITSRAAEIFRIKDRGRLVVGAHADLMLFDPNTVARGPKRRVHDLPTGAARLDTPAVGLHGVWIDDVGFFSVEVQSHWPTVCWSGTVRRPCSKPFSMLPRRWSLLELPPSEIPIPTCRV